MSVKTPGGLVRTLLCHNYVIALHALHNFRLFTALSWMYLTYFNHTLVPRSAMECIPKNLIPFCHFSVVAFWFRSWEVVVDSTSRASFIYFQRGRGIYMRREVYQIHDTLLFYHNATWLFRTIPILNGARIGYIPSLCCVRILCCTQMFVTKLILVYL